jgi:DNA-binding response OmpR family regulator
MNATPIVVAVFNTSPDTVDLLRIVLEHAGFVVVTAFTWELRDGEVDLEAFCREHSPAIVVYDVAPPYEANWRLFLHLRETEALRNCDFVITTTHVKHVRELAGPHLELFEVIGKPYDLGLIVDQVTKLAQKRTR